METKFQTSFIPRKPLVPNSAAAPVASSGGGSTSILVFIGVILLLLSVASAIGVFAWEKIEAKKIEENKVALETNRKKFGSDIEVLKKFNDRINLSKQLVDNHLAVSNIFSILADATVDKVRFTSFSLDIPENPLKDKIEVIMGGEAQSFAGLAYQADVFSENTQIRESSISDLSTTDKGNVRFKFNAVIPFEEIVYKKQFETEVAPEVTPQTNE